MAVDGRFISSGVFATFVLALAILVPTVHGQGHGGSAAQAPAPASDGTMIDQGIAYVLMVLALVLTYLIHTLAPSFGI